MNRILDLTKPKLSKRFEKYWDDPKLKLIHQKALLSVYMENEKNRLLQHAIAHADERQIRHKCDPGP